MLLEICSNTSLHDMLKRRKRLLEIEVQSYTIALVNAVRHIHSKNVIHRDLKLGNILLKEIDVDDGYVKDKVL